MNGYLIERINERFYLTHGCSTPGVNNSVPIRSLMEALTISEAWLKAKVNFPYNSGASGR